MIIDATTGSIARFVNHSCNPNCRMVKWIVAGQPRMALFAGDGPIMTGDELTYDYNFNPFSAKSVQRCLCGEDNCRGLLGPKPRDVKPPKTDLKKTVKATVKKGKRKLKELIGDEEAGHGAAAKKRKIAPAKGVKRSLSNASLKAAKGAATAIKKSVNSITASAKKAGLGKQPLQRRASTGAVVKKTSAKKLAKKFGQQGRGVQISSRASSMTIVAVADGTPSKKGKASAVKKSPASGKKSPGKKSPASTKASVKRTVSGSTKASRISTGSVRSVTSPRRIIKPTAKAKIRVVT